MKGFFPLCLLIQFTLLCSVVGGADALPKNPVDKKEFPALQLLPAGTVLENITLPRYKDARVTSLMKLERLLILSNTLMRIDGLNISMFSEDGGIQRISSDSAEYDFEQKTVRTQGATHLLDDRIRIQGNQIFFDTQTQRGMLKGPVRSVFSVSLRQASPAQATKANAASKAPANAASKAPANAASKAPANAASNVAIASPDFLAKREQFASFPAAQQYRQRAQDMLRTMKGEIAATAADVNALMRELPPHAPPPAEPLLVKKGESVVDCTEGLYFDPAKSLLSYIGKVRLRDAQFNLDCERLYLHLEKKELDEELESVKEIEASEEMESSDNKKITKEESVPSPLVVKAGESEKAPVPYKLRADEVMLDFQQNRVYARGEHIAFSRNGTRIELKGGSPRLLVWDNMGIIYMQADHIIGSFLDSKGAKTHFSTQGSAMFLLDTNSLVLEKNNKLQTAQHLLTCKGMIRMQLIPSIIPSKAPAGRELVRGVFPRLQGRFEGLSHISMMDSVKLSGISERSGEKFEITGDLLSYNAQNGETILSGDDILIVQGDQNMRLRDKSMLCLMSDGSINVSARSMDGQYVRYMQSKESTIATAEHKKNEPLRLMGKFKTSGKISFLAADATLRFSEGLILKDDLLDFSTQAELLIHLMKDDPQAAKGSKRPQLATTNAMQKKSPAVKNKQAWVTMPNSKIGEYKYIQSFHSLGATKINSRGESSFSLRGDDIYLDILHGKAKIQAQAGRWAELSYSEHQFKAFSSDRLSSMELFDNGDAKVYADNIEIRLPSVNKNNLSSITCADSLEVFRQRAEVHFGKDIRLNDASLKFASQGPLIAYLRANSTTKSNFANYPHLNYNFAALDSIKTSTGATIQAANYSMQCDGDLIIYMAEQAKVKAITAAGFKSATATKNVRLALRDKSGALYRAQGDRLHINGQTGEKILSGKRVILQDKSSIHVASGPNAFIHGDKDNNISFRGKNQLSLSNQDIKMPGVEEIPYSIKRAKDKSNKISGSLRP